ncbi:hypothetical protein, partial [Mesorhizobium sp. M1A.F.Ca.IN.020.30.1.1]|uniref:hypothetical protein n=1 Tax=Mesorhizobium sp. M1A.F.Ca.IN.020.30.1.1 TaxID=2496762 RepID=UPI0019D4E2C1
AESKWIDGCAAPPPLKSRRRIPSSSIAKGSVLNYGSVRARPTIAIQQDNQKSRSLLGPKSFLLS